MAFGFRPATDTQLNKYAFVGKWPLLIYLRCKQAAASGEKEGRLPRIRWLPFGRGEQPLLSMAARDTFPSTVNTTYLTAIP